MDVMDYSLFGRRDLFTGRRDPGSRLTSTRHLSWLNPGQQVAKTVGPVCSKYGWAHRCSCEGHRQCLGSVSPASLLMIFEGDRSRGREKRDVTG